MAQSNNPMGILACPECGEEFAVRHHRQMFCSSAHQRSYNNRQLGRGQALVGLAQAWRGGRNGTPEDRIASKQAFAELCRLVSQFNTEDDSAKRIKPVRLYRRRQAMNHLA